MIKNKSEKYFQTRYIPDKGRQAVWKAIVEDLSLRFIEDRSRVLELGCGYGDFINQVDSSDRSAIDLHDVSGYLEESIKFNQSTISNLDQYRKDFSLVFCSNLMEHLEYKQGEKMVSDVFNLLADRGRFILIQPNFRLCFRRYFDDYTHRTVFTDVSLCGLLEANGFRVVYRKAGYLPFSMNGMLPSSYWLTKFFLMFHSPLIGKQMLVVGEKI